MERDPKLTEFCYMDTWDGLNKWVRVRGPMHAHAAPKYISVQLFSSSVKKDGEESYYGAWWDMDSKDLALALSQTQTLVRWLLGIGVPEDAIRCKFSGGKGFHTFTPPSVWGVQPSERLHVSMKAFCVGVATALGLSTVDDAVYSSRRMARTPGSRHDKTGKVATPLSAKQILALTSDDLASLGDVDVKVDTPHPQAFSKRFAPVGWIHWEPYLTKSESQEPTGGRNEVVPGSNPVCLQSLMEEGLFLEGTQNKAAVIIASFLRARGDALEDAEKTLGTWAQAVPKGLTSKDTAAVLKNCESVLRSIYGAKDPFFSCSAMRSVGARCNQAKCTAVAGNAAEDPAQVDLSTLIGTFHPELMGKPIAFRGQVSATAKLPKAIPEIAAIRCEVGCGAACSRCPVSSKGASVSLHPAKRPQLALELLCGVKASWRKTIFSGCGIPEDCEDTRKRLEFETFLAFSVTEVSPVVGGEKERQRSNVVYIPNHDIRAADHYEIEAFTAVHPKTNDMVQVAYRATKVSRSWEAPLTPEELKSLDVFKGRDVAKKIEDIYISWERGGVHDIVGRGLEVMAMALCFLSPLRLRFEARPIRGALHILAYGDTGQAKTAIFDRWREWFGVGEIINAENTTVAGLTAGVDKIDGANTTKFGELVRLNGELAGLDEFHGAPKALRSSMSDVLSSGVVSMSKITGTVKAEALLRLIFLSNAVNGFGNSKKMRDILYPVEWIEKIMSTPEDVRRLDYAIAFATRADIEVNADRPEREETEYTKEAAQALVRWTWQLPEVEIPKETSSACRSLAREMSKRYSRGVALCEPGDLAEKICRLASAIAAQLFSQGEGGGLLVTPEHAEFAVEVMDSLYMSPDMKYAQYSIESVERVPTDADVREAKDKWVQIQWSENTRKGIPRAEATETLLHHLIEVRNAHFTAKSVADVMPGLTEVGVKMLFATLHRLGWTQPVGDRLRITETGVVGLSMWRTAFRDSEKGNKNSVYSGEPLPPDVAQELEGIRGPGAIP